MFGEHCMLLWRAKEGRGGEREGMMEKKVVQKRERIKEIPKSYVSMHKCVCSRTYDNGLVLIYQTSFAEWIDWIHVFITVKHESGSGKPKNARTGGSGITTVDELVGLLSQEGQTHMSFNTENIQKDESNTDQHHRDHSLWGWSEVSFSLPKPLFPITVRFSCIYISQGDVAT